MQGTTGSVRVLIRSITINLFHPFEVRIVREITINFYYKLQLEPRYVAAVARSSMIRYV